jgi:hypothetical protein
MRESLNGCLFYPILAKKEVFRPNIDSSHVRKVLEKHGEQEEIKK